MSGVEAKVKSRASMQEMKDIFRTAHVFYGRVQSRCVSCSTSFKENKNGANKSVKQICIVLCSGSGGCIAENYVSDYQGLIFRTPNLQFHYYNWR